MDLRSYQTNTVNAVRDSLKSGHKRPLFVLPTGSGKTPVFCWIAKTTSENGKKILILLHRRNLVYQTQSKLKEYYNIDAGIIMAGVSSNLKAPIQLASIWTYGRRIMIDDPTYNSFFINADVILIDEGHVSPAKTYEKVLNQYNGKIIIGCTATPCRSDGRGLGDVFDDLIVGPGINELTEQGYLCPIKYYVPTTIDLDGVPVYKNDYQQKALGEKVNKKKLIGDVVENWLKLAENQKTIVFCVNVKHSIAICEEFNRHGIPAEHLDAHSTDDERDAVFSKMERGDITVICNVYLYNEGLDVPSVSCIALARPTRHIGTYRQMVGRGMRPEEGKDHLKILDFGNIVANLGCVEWNPEWTLDGKKKSWSKPRRETVKKLVKCIACGLVFEGRNVCPDCGTQVRAFGQTIETIDAELEELDAKKEKGTVLEKRLFLGMLRHYIPRQRNPNPKRVLAIFRERYGVWPGNSYKDVAPIPPDQAFLNRMKHQQIKYIKRKEKEARANVS